MLLHFKIRILGNTSTDVAQASPLSGGEIRIFGNPDTGVAQASPLSKGKLEYLATLTQM